MTKVKPKQLSFGFMRRVPPEIGNYVMHRSLGWAGEMKVGINRKGYTKVLIERGLLVDVHWKHLEVIEVLKPVEEKQPHG